MLHHAHISILQALRTGSYPAPCDKSHSEHLTPPSLSLSCAGRVWAENKLCYDVTLMACASFPSSHLWSIISAKIARYGIDNTKAMSHTQRERSMPFGRRSPPFGRRFISFGRRSISFGRRSISRRSEGDIVQGSYGDLRNRHIYIYWFCHSCPETPTAFPSVFIA